MGSESEQVKMVWVTDPKIKSSASFKASCWQPLSVRGKSYYYYSEKKKVKAFIFNALSIKAYM
tara:strand:- start:3998 stop:4186 length:189 start_codon:yes stop_codon:yes gene_type:complete